MERINGKTPDDWKELLEIARAATAEADRRTDHFEAADPCPSCVVAAEVDAWKAIASIPIEYLTEQETRVLFVIADKVNSIASKQNQ